MLVFFFFLKPYSLFALPGYFCVFLPPGIGPGQFFLQLVFMVS